MPYTLSAREKWVRVLLNVFGMGIILRTSAHLIFNPSFFEDEGLYMGATAAILRGDWLMTHFGIDKPFLLGFMPIPGILALGPFPLGFRLVSIVLYLASFIITQQILGFFSKSYVRNFLISLIVFCLPLVQVHGISNFCEPYLIFFTVLMFKNYFKPTETEKSVQCTHNAFFAGLMIKYSMVMWVPLFFLDQHWLTPIQRANKKAQLSARITTFISTLKTFLWRGRVWLGLWFLFGLVNAVKFGSVNWLGVLFVGPARDLNFFQRFAKWVELLFQAIPLTGFNSISIALVIVGVFINKNWKARALCAVVVLHFIGIAFSGAFLINRYLVIFLPGLFLAVGLTLNELVIHTFKHASQISQRAFNLGLICVLALISSYMILLPKEGYGGDPVLGRRLYVLREELNDPRAFLQTDSLWKSTAFRLDMKTAPCITDECVSNYRKGNAVNPFHYLFIGANAHSVPEIWRAPLVVGGESLTTHKMGVHTVARTIHVPFSKIELIQNILASLKLHKAIEVTQAILGPQVALTPNPQIKLRRLFNGPEVSIVGILKNKNNFMQALFGTLPEVQIVGRIGVNELKDRETYNAPQPTLVFEVEHLFLNQKEVTDLMPIFFMGYTTRIGVLPLSFATTSSIAVEDLIYDGAKEEWIVKMVGLSSIAVKSE